MYAYKKVYVRLSIALALVVWVWVSLSILQEVIESRKNTIAARETGYIQEDVKTTIATSQIIVSEPSILTKVFGLIFFHVAIIWSLLWIGFLACCFCIGRFKQKNIRLKEKGRMTTNTI